MGELHSGIRRLCVAAATASTGMLADACQIGEIGRLYVIADQSDGTEMAFAPPGVDEAALVTGLIAGLHRLAASHAGAPSPVLTAFHVGITKIEGDEFGGQAVLRTRGLLVDPAIRAISDGCGQPLAAAMSEGLYIDLQVEGLPSRHWLHVPAAGAWLWCGGAPWTTQETSRS